MEVVLRSTTKIVNLVVGGHSVPARVWEGTTAGGLECHAYITRIAVHKDDDAREFDAELQEHTPPSAAIQEIPLSLIL